MTVLPAGTPPIPITMVGKFKTRELYYHYMSEHYWSVLLWIQPLPGVS